MIAIGKRAAGSRASWIEPLLHISGYQSVIDFCLHITIAVALSLLWALLQLAMLSPDKYHQ